MHHPRRVEGKASCSDALLEESRSKSGRAARPRIFHRRSACTHHSAACSAARSPVVRKSHRVSAAAGVRKNVLPHTGYGKNDGDAGGVSSGTLWCMHQATLCRRAS